jgi:L-ascorbate metabolism protein UlaG (beta-lactamase superfamily)
VSTWATADAGSTASPMARLSWERPRLPPGRTGDGSRHRVAERARRRTLPGVATPSPVEITWVGHATVVIEIDGMRVLTDPALTPRLAHLRRHHPVDLDAIGDIDAIVISHLHMDHLHLPSLRLLRPGALVVVPKGAAPLVRRLGATTREVVAGDHLTVGEIDVEVVPAVHSDRRGPHRRRRASAIGYVLRGRSGSVYFPGDTDLFAAMGDIGPVDAALLPIGGWGPSVGEGHLDPDGAARASLLLQPRLVVPIHWGTYSPVALRRGEPSWLRRPADRFATAMDAAGHGERVVMVEPSRRLVLPPATRSAPPS